jgi:hypothetical protein
LRALCLPPSRRGYRFHYSPHVVRTAASARQTSASPKPGRMIVRLMNHLNAT